MNDSKVFVLVTKDALCRDYLHFYGDKKGQFKTPNLDELVSNGTLFTRYYAAAASTVMAFYSMAVGVYSYETDIQMYERVHQRIDGDTVFTEAKKYGYDSFHIIWGKGWETLPGYYDYFREDVKIHTIETLKATTGIYKKEKGKVVFDRKLATGTMHLMENLFTSVLNEKGSKFIWIHLPHVLNGCDGYGSDIGVFDDYVGMFRKYIPDDCLAISADHGNMNGKGGKLAYGFDLHDNVIRIPLIMPKLADMAVCNKMFSQIDLFNLIFSGKVPEREFVFSETAYRAQKHRKLAILYDKYKYIYNKESDTEELYDLEYDPLENISIMNERFYDVDRRLYIDMCEEYYYPDWDKLDTIRTIMRNQKDKIWRDGDLSVILKSNIKDAVRPFYERWKRFKKSKRH